GVGLAGLAARREVRPIRRETTAVAGAPFALGEARPREPIAQGARRYPDLLRDDRPGVTFVSERPGALVLRQPLGPPGRPGHVGTRSWRDLRGIRRVERRWSLARGSVWGASRRGVGLGERWRPGQAGALAELHLDRFPEDS